MILKTAPRLMFIPAAILLLLFAGMGVPAFGARRSGLIVRTAAGWLQGAPRSHGGAIFSGIPYGQPPVGDLRWHQPLPAKSWRGIRDATKFAPSCMQADQGEWNHEAAKGSSEDCLYLNVVTPVWPAQGLLPVLFWIHGGGNAGGTSTGEFIRAGTLPDHGVLVVTVEYRLGIFGFFAHPDLTRAGGAHGAGNFALMDQILALRWVVDNIRQFGGDPNNITVGGQSAGAEDAGFLMMSPARGLFQKAIAESGTPLLVTVPSLARAEDAGRRFALALGVREAEDPLRALRAISARELVDRTTTPTADVKLLMGPIVDGWIIRDEPSKAYAVGEQAKIPILIGSNSVEFGSSLPADQLRHVIGSATGGFANDALELYGLNGNGTGISDPIYGSAADQWFADWRFHCPAATVAMWHAAAGNRVYLYQFDFPLGGHASEGARHTGELPYVFGWFPKSGFLSGEYGDAEHHEADLVESYWANFMRTGNPNSPQLIMWPEFGTSRRYLQFLSSGQAMASAGEQRKQQCDLYRKVHRVH